MHPTKLRCLCPKVLALATMMGCLQLVWGGFAMVVPHHSLSLQTCAGLRTRTLVVALAPVAGHVSCQRLARIVLSATSDDNDDDGTQSLGNVHDSIGSNNNSNKSAVGRAGGRTTRRRQTPRPAGRSVMTPLLPAGGILLALLVLSLNPFAIIGSTEQHSEKGGGTYYYESRVYERRVYNQNDGSVQTLRKQSVHTNVPSLLGTGNPRLLSIEDKKNIDQGYTRPSIEHDDF